uniref:Uncharacterized protein n=1 Tax=Anguilla anguilla TaxID=7936 RepID=A0A0E9SZB5_ANGAN
MSTQFANQTFQMPKKKPFWVNESKRFNFCPITIMHLNVFHSNQEHQNLQQQRIFPICEDQLLQHLKL